ncbi:MAG: adenine deaminase C-terminal domain-containing protein [Desulfobacterales bacterium]|jgi:adenine deaminase|nr:adenine deaminase C-terminal domain-containing protein [Desulfobacterales bacterium]
MNGFGPIDAVKNRNSRLLMNVALGRSPADLVIVNAKLINVYTAEILDDYGVGVKDGWIAYVGKAPTAMIGPETQCIDAQGKFLVPGFIDGHTHLAWNFSIDEFLKHAIPGGTTTIISEVNGSYPASGIAGVRDCLSSFQNQPIKIFATAPALVFTSEKSQVIRTEELQSLLDRHDVLGLGESYWQGILQLPEVYLWEFEQTLQRGKVIEGHSAGARDHKLAAYTACGVTSCHEPISAEEAIERLRMGIYVMAREGSSRQDLKAISEIKDKKVDLRRLILVTDGIAPGDLIKNGYMENVVRQAVAYGFDPITAIQMTTINVAEHFLIDHLVGGIAPGRYADMLVLPDLDTFLPEWVVSCGKVVARNGRVTVPPRKHDYSQHSRNSVQLPKTLVPADFSIRSPSPMKPEATVRAIEMRTDLVTVEKIMTLPVDDGEIHISTDRDLLKVAAIDRGRIPGKMFTGLILGFGLKTGALAASTTWDSSDLLVVGTNESDMALAINRIAQMQGGVVLFADGRMVTELAMPVFGYLSEAPMPEIAVGIKTINETAKAFGVPFSDPVLTLSTLTASAIPYLKISEKGYVNLKDGSLYDLFTDL